MTSDDLRKLLNEYRKEIYHVQKDPVDRDDICRSIGFQDAVELLWPLVEALENHHNLWSDNNNCMSECSLLCKALKDLKEKLKGG